MGWPTFLLRIFRFRGGQHRCQCPKVSTRPLHLSFSRGPAVIEPRRDGTPHALLPTCPDGQSQALTQRWKARRPAEGRLQCTTWASTNLREFVDQLLGVHRMKIGDAMKDWRAGAAGAALLVVMLPAAAGANPIGAAGAGALVEDRPARVVQQVAVRCWWRNGVRRCRWSGARVYGYYGGDYRYGNPRPEAYRTGSAGWWRAMERWGRTGPSPR